MPAADDVQLHHRPQEPLPQQPPALSGKDSTRHNSELLYRANKDAYRVQLVMQRWRASGLLMMTSSCTTGQLEEPLPQQPPALSRQGSADNPCQRLHGVTSYTSMDAECSLSMHAGCTGLQARCI
jgi:hypothetical protein